jgi:SAM-dependent methyltransferase
MSRPCFPERPEYVVGPPVEAFMVPLLDGAIRSVLDALPDDAAWRVLDVGCGGQPFRSVFERKGHSYVSCDAVDPTGIVDHVAEIDSDLPAELVDDGPFDFVLCSEVLEHVFDWDRAFANLSRLVAPGGRMLLTIPFVYPLHEQPYDFWRPTPHAIRRMSERHGLEIVTLETRGDVWDVLGTVGGAVFGSARPRDQSLTARLSSRLTNLAIRVSLGLLRRPWLRDRVALENSYLPLHLTTVAVLERAR